MVYSPSYEVADISAIIIDFVGTLLAVLVDNAPILITLIILGVITSLFLKIWIEIFRFGKSLRP